METLQQTKRFVIVKGCAETAGCDDVLVEVGHVVSCEDISLLRAQFSAQHAVSARVQLQGR